MEKLESSNETGWPALLDALLAGISHHVSNRVAVLAGVSDILSQDASIPPILRALVDEIPKLEEGVRLLRLLATQTEEQEEALQAQQVMGDVMALLAVHPSVKGKEVQVEFVGEVPPVVARATDLLHTVLVMVVEQVGRGARVVRVVEDGDDVVIGVGDREIRVKLLRRR